jgi:thiamine pyrophosphate-dependent acetolactate synthase large subunit-like protein
MQSLNESVAAVATNEPLNRFALTKRLVGRLTKGEAVIGGIGNTNFDLWSAGQRPENFYMLGSMGLAVPIALGVALAQPHRQVFALEGDGSLLMQLGCLSTVSAQRPVNLTIVVFDNRCYQITGAQPTATSTGTDIVAVAKACGLSQSQWARSEAHFEELAAQSLSHQGPCLIGALVDGKSAVGTTERFPTRIGDRFMTAMATSASGAN